MTFLKIRMVTKILACAVAGWYLVLIVGFSLLFYIEGGHVPLPFGATVIASCLLSAALFSFRRPKAAALACSLISLVHFAASWQTMSRFPNATLMLTLRYELILSHTGWYFIIPTALITWAAFFSEPAPRETA